MPYYYDLKSDEKDTLKTKAKKKRVAENLGKLRVALADHFEISGSHEDVRKSVRIMTWNLRDFGAGKHKGRDYEPLYYIAEIISHADIVALQEINGNLDEFKQLLKILGPDWDFLATDVTDGSAGNGERMVFVYNRRYAQFKNIAGELTLKEGAKIKAAFGERIVMKNDITAKMPNDKPTLSGTYKARLETKAGKKRLASDLEIDLPPGSILNLPEGSQMVIKKGTEVLSPKRGHAKVQIPRTLNKDHYAVRFPENSFDDSLRQFARTPYLVSFRAGWLNINLCTVHIYYGDASDAQKLEQRRSEIEKLAEALAGKADGEFKQKDDNFLGVLGDFNIIGKDHPTMAALESNGFEIPDNLKEIPGSNVKRNMAYDQIAFWKPKRKRGYRELDILAANIFDFFETVFRTDDQATYMAEAAENGLDGRIKYDQWRTYKMSDHLPMWIELRTDFSDEYLEMIEGG